MLGSLLVLWIGWQFLVRFLSEKFYWYLTKSIFNDNVIYNSWGGERLDADSSSELFSHVCIF